MREALIFVSFSIGWAALMRLAYLLWLRTETGQLYVYHRRLGFSRLRALGRTIYCLL